MTGLVTRSRPFQGEGTYILPRGFKLFPKVNDVQNFSAIKINDLTLLPKVTTQHPPLLVNVMRGTFKLLPKASATFPDDFVKINKYTAQGNNENIFGSERLPPASDFLTNITKVGGWSLWLYGSSFMSILNSTDSSWFQTSSGQTMVLDFIFSRTVKVRSIDLYWDKTGVNVDKLSDAVHIYALDSSNNEIFVETVDISDSSIFRDRPVRISLTTTSNNVSDRFRCKFTKPSGYNGLQYFRLV